VRTDSARAYAPPERNLACRYVAVTTHVSTGTLARDFNDD
jgi:hypothetical protein